MKTKIMLLVSICVFSNAGITQAAGPCSNGYTYTNGHCVLKIDASEPLPLSQPIEAAKPVATKAEPVVVTPKPVSSSSKPVAVTQKPRVAEAVREPGRVVDKTTIKTPSSENKPEKTVASPVSEPAKDSGNKATVEGKSEQPRSSTTNPPQTPGPKVSVCYYNKHYTISVWKNAGVTTKKYHKWTKPYGDPNAESHEIPFTQYKLYCLDLDPR